MIGLWALLGAATAQAGCPELVPRSDSATPYRVDEKHTFSGDQAACGRLVLGKASRLRIEDLKVVLKTWDDTRRIFGSERLYRDEGAWVLDIPELQDGDQIRLRLLAVPLGLPDSGSEAATLGLGVPQRMVVGWRSSADAAVFGPGGNVEREVMASWQGQYSSGVHRVWVPNGATGVQCQASSGGHELTVQRNEYGCSVDFSEAGQASVTLGWVQEGVGPSGEWRLVEGQALEIKNPEIEYLGLAPEEGSHVFTGPGHVSVMLSAIGSEPVQNVAQQEVDEAAKLVSIPEPGIGLKFKGRQGGMEVVPEVLSLVREQVNNGQLLGSHPLKARPLMQVRKSGWATPWEQALLLTRYLGQLKVPATAYPVRPQAFGRAVDGAPDGYGDAVVRAGSGDEAVWIDPSCRVCAVGEIDPALWGGQVFSLDLNALPDDRGGSVRTQLEEGRLRVELLGAAALRLRIWLLPIPASDRGRLAAELFGGPGASLVEHTGFSDLGGPIRLLVQP